jgi:hypothetical protein
VSFSVEADFLGYLLSFSSFYKTLFHPSFVNKMQLLTLQKIAASHHLIISLSIFAVC